MHMMVQGDRGVLESDYKGDSVSDDKVAVLDDKDAAHFFGQHTTGKVSRLSQDWLLLDIQSSMDMQCQVPHKH